MQKKMRKRDKLFILNYFLNILNAFILVLGLMLVAFGLWISHNQNTIFIILLSTGEHSLITSVSHMLLAIGCIVVFTGLLGYFRSLQRIRCLLVVYMGLLVLVLISHVTMIGLLFTGKQLVNNLWKAQLDELISSYGNKKIPRRANHWDSLNAFQHMFHCCGRYNSTDWKWNEHKEHLNQVPCSCMASKAKKWFCDEVKNATFTRGCEEEIRKWYEENTWILMSLSTGLVLLEVLQFIAVAQLHKTMRRNTVVPKQ